MSSVSWTSTVSGDWSNAANWSGGAVPGPQDDVTINTGTALTVTFSSAAASVLSLFTGGLDTLDVTGGTLAVDGNASLAGALVESGGTLLLAGAQYMLAGGLQQAGGAIRINSGTLTLGAGSNVIGGSITGATLALTGGTDSITATARLGVAQLQIAGAAVTLAENLTQAGLFTASSGILAIGAQTLTLNGANGLTGGTLSGTGSLVLGGVTNLAGTIFEGSLAVSNTGTLIETNNGYFGYVGADSVSFINAAKAMWRLNEAVLVSGNVNALIVNAGTLFQASSTGTSEIRDNFASTGTVSIAGGSLQFDGSSNNFSGTVSGAGTFVLEAGATVLAKGLALSVGSLLLDGASVTLGGNVTYAGAYAQTAGTLALGGNNFGLTGTAALEGGTLTGSGKLTLSGTTWFSGATLAGALAVTNSGTLVQSGIAYVGFDSGDSVTFTNAATGIYRMDGGLAIYSLSGAGFVNAGLFDKSSAATSFIYTPFASTGIVSVDAGALAMQGATTSLGGTVGGGGTLALNGAATGFARGLKLTIGSVLIQDTVLSLGSNLTYGNIFAQTAGTLSLGSFSLTLNGAVSLDGGALLGGGVLTAKSATVYDYFIGATATLQNTGTLTINSVLFDGFNAGDAASVINSGAKSVLLLASNANLYGSAGSTLTNAGLINKSSGAGTSEIQPNFSNTGTLQVSVGTLRLTGVTDSLAGKISGAGNLELYSGTDGFASGVAVTVAGLTLDGATLSLGGALSYAGSFFESSGVLALGTNGLTLTGPALFTGGLVSGSGTITASGTTTIAGGLALTGSVVLKNSGTLVQSSGWSIGSSVGDVAQLQNTPAGTIRIENNSIMSGQAGDLFSNAGTVMKTGGGRAQIGVTLINSGTMSVAGGALYLSGGANVVAGTVAGAGALHLSSGTTTIGGATLTVSALTLDGAQMTLATNESYGGLFGESGGTLTPGGNTLTLSGSDAMNGGVVVGTGTLALSGQSTIANGWAAEGSVALLNSGTLISDNSWYLGFNANDTASFTNKASGVLVLGDSEIYAQSGDTVVNAGTIVKSLGDAGMGYIQAALTNSGTVSVTQGGLTCLAGVGGNGLFSLGAGTALTFSGAVSGAGTVSLGAVSDLTVQGIAGFADTISGFASGDVIDVGGIAWTGTLSSFTFDSVHDRLAVTNGSSSATLQLAGAYTAASFALFNDNGIIGVTHI